MLLCLMARLVQLSLCTCCTILFLDVISEIVGKQQYASILTHQVQSIIQGVSKVRKLS